MDDKLFNYHILKYNLGDIVFQKYEHSIHRCRVEGYIYNENNPKLRLFRFDLNECIDVDLYDTNISINFYTLTSDFV